MINQFKLVWNNDKPAKNFDACLDPDDGGALIVSLDRPGFEMHLSYEHIDQMNHVVNELSVGISYYASDMVSGFGEASGNGSWGEFFHGPASFWRWGRRFSGGKEDSITSDYDMPVGFHLFGRVQADFDAEEDGLAVFSLYRHGTMDGHADALPILI